MAARGERGRWGRRARVLLWWLLVASAFLLPYEQLPWWSFPASTLTLVLLFALRWRKAAPNRMGLSLGSRGALATIALGALLWAAFRFVLVPAITGAHGVVLEPSPPLRVAEFAFQALNEEIVLGYLLVVGVARWSGRPVLAALGVAALFAILHHVLYHYGTLQRDLLPATLATLFAVGVVRNASILLADHVGYAWALHAAWNLVMFEGQWVEEASGRRLTEPEVLDAFLGGAAVIVPAGVAAVVLLALLRRRP